MQKKFKNLAEFLKKNYGNATKIVEVGVGSERYVLNELKMSTGCEVVGVDIKGGEGLVRDDVLSPSLEIYRNADLIYALRPPPELYPALISLAARVNADLIIRPMSTDPPPEGMKLVNYRGEFFYIKKRSP
ncbi:UPF0146 family protein [Candidatus Pyrohabitans sp.]